MAKVSILYVTCNKLNIICNYVNSYIVQFYSNSVFITFHSTLIVAPEFIVKSKDQVVLTVSTWGPPLQEAVAL